MGAQKLGYLPTLDGWRAIAVLMTVLQHEVLLQAGPLSTSWIHAHGRLGVDIFFGISGLLICSRLMDEESAHGKISLKEFYIRRAFRIVPPMFLYLLVVGALSLLGLLMVYRREWFAALLFYRNYSTLSEAPGQSTWFTLHYWSLSVEEHFYLLLPGLLLIARGKWRLSALGALIVAVDAWRIFRQQTHPYPFLANHTDTRLDALLFPALLAVVLANTQGREFLLRVCRFWFIPAGALFALLTIDRSPVLTPVAQSFLIPWMLLGTVLHPSGVFAKVLEFAPFRWIGRISYSLYLWQELFFVARFHPEYHSLGRLQDSPWKWLMLLLCASLSYYAVEKPLMRLGHRIAPPVTPGRPETAVAPVSV
jgi:peptidoglycan/LPS O-acetylase OafA/YrhL